VTVFYHNDVPRIRKRVTFKAVEARSETSALVSAMEDFERKHHLGAFSRIAAKAFKRRGRQRPWSQAA
jgi:hypothetical protein